MSSDKSRKKELARYSKKSKYTAACGDIVFQQLIGTDTLRLYANGFASIGGVFKEPEPEKLIAITIDVETAKKTGPGRLVAGVITGGANLLLTGNVRGDIYVNVQTEKGVSSIHERFPTNDLVAELRRLEMIVSSMLAATNAHANQAAPEAQAPDTEKLEQLKALFEKGLIDADEYASAKAKLLGL